MTDTKNTLMRHAIILLLVCCRIYVNPQCPKITQTTTDPNCKTNCELCSGDKLTIHVSGNDLPDNGVIAFYADSISGFDPYQGQGTFIGSGKIKTTNPKCRICPQLLGFMIDACGTESKNEFLIIWTGSGFNTSDFNFDYAIQNNIFGAPNNDIGPGGCGITNGNPGLINGCSAISVGNNYNLPPNSIWIVFTSISAFTNYDFSSVCGLSCKLFVSSSTCDRTIGAFSNFDATPGPRTQLMNISSCNCSTIAIYTIPGSMTGQGDFWAEGSVVNNGCATPSFNLPNYNPAMSTVDPFNYTIPKNWCNTTYEIVGIVNPQPDLSCCTEEFTDRLTVFVNCPVANSTTLESCETNNGRSDFILENADAFILTVPGGTVDYFRDIQGILKLNSPFNSGSTTIYARVTNGNCSSALVPVKLNVLLLPVAKSITAEICDDGSGYADFDLSLLETEIKNGNNNATVHYYFDQSKRIPLSSIYHTGSTTIYATVSDAKCESKPSPIYLKVINKPQASDTILIQCSEIEDKATFILNNQTLKIANSQPLQNIRFFKEPSLINEIKSSYLSASDTVYAIISNTKCTSDLITIILKVITPEKDTVISETSCEDKSGFGIFKLDQIKKKLHLEDTSALVEWFKDSTSLIQVQPPIIIQGMDSIYAIITKNGCPSNPIKIKLQTTVKPIAKSFMWNLCSSNTDSTVLNLNELEDSIRSKPGLKVLFSKDRFFTQLINLNYSPVQLFDTIFTAVEEGECRSNPEPLIVHTIQTPVFKNNKDTTACAFFVVPFLQGIALSPSAHYYSTKDLYGKKLNTGDTLIHSGMIYLYDNSEGCTAQDSTYIHIAKKPSAGNDQAISVCEYTTVHLNRYLNGSDPGGFFINLDNCTGFSDSVVNIKSQNGNSFRFAYLIASDSICPADTSIITIQVVKNVFAGNDSAFSICENSKLNIDPGSLHADPGGQFIDSLLTGALTEFIWDGTRSGPGNFILKYEIGDDISCPKDQAYIFIHVKPSVVIDKMNNFKSCEFVTLPEITGKNTNKRTSYYSMRNGKGKIYSPGDSIFQNIRLYVFARDTSYCSAEDSTDVEVLHASYSTFYQTNLCPDQVYQIGNSSFDIHHPSGQEIIRGGNQFGCDSIILVNLNYEQINTSIYNTRLCKGDQLLLHGKVYSEYNMNGIDTLKQSSAFGCDSIVQVIIESVPPAIFNYSAELCEPDSIQIGNLLFDRMHSKLRDTLKGMAQNGCDSIRDIQIKIIPVAIAYFNKTLCNEESIFINGTRYDTSKSSGIELFRSGAANGCDSMVSIQLAFAPNYSAYYSDTLCPDESILVNGTEYNIKNKSGTEHLLSYLGCDSIIHINFHFNSLNLSYSKDVYLFAGQSRQLIIYPEFKPQSIQWSPDKDLSCDDCLNPIASPKENTTYTLFLTDSMGCSTSVQINIHADTSNSIYLPNAFSPNNDLINDIFKPTSPNSKLFISQFIIYDRWGNLIYSESNKPIDNLIGWDGRTINHTQLDPGVFVYYIKLITSGKEYKIISGNISLIR